MAELAVRPTACVKAVARAEADMGSVVPAGGRARGEGGVKSALPNACRRQTGARIARPSASTYYFLVGWCITIQVDGVIKAARSPVGACHRSARSMAAATESSLAARMNS